MIARYWRGLAKSSFANAYIEHLHTETFPQLANLPGFVNVLILRRELGDGTEFLIVTVWESREAIARFSGPDIETAVVPEKVQSLMIEYDAHARHYEIVV
ncbi:MAG: antibiotic biosynthesis monooxygenase family protein [Acidobacteriota bacterium]